MGFGDANADHYGRKIMVLRAMPGMGLVMALVPLAQTPLWFAVLVVLVGFFYGYMNASAWRRFARV